MGGFDKLSLGLRLLLLSFLVLHVVDAQDGEAEGGPDEGGGGNGADSACDKNFDLVFVIDGSGSIEQAGKGNFKLIKNFVKDVIGGFNIGFDQTHVGAIIFSASQYVKKSVWARGSLYKRRP